MADPENKRDDVMPPGGAIVFPLTVLATGMPGGAFGVSADQTVGQLRAAIESRVKIPADRMTLIYAGERRNDDDVILADILDSECQQIHVMPPLGSPWFGSAILAHGIVATSLSYGPIPHSCEKRDRWARIDAEPHPAAHPILIETNARALGRCLAPHHSAGFLHYASVDVIEDSGERRVILTCDINEGNSYVIRPALEVGRAYILQISAYMTGVEIRFVAC